MSDSFYVTDAAISKDPIVSLSVLASADPSPTKMMAVEGAAMDDAAQLIVPEALRWASEEISTNGLNTAYCPSTGLPELADLILVESTGQETLDYIQKLGVSHAALVCSGGTSAISLALASCVSRQEPLIVQTPHWSGYDSIALALGLATPINFDFLDKQGRFNLEGLKTTINELPRTAKLSIILNSPFDNPLSCSIKDTDWRDLAKFLAELPPREITIILDTAYMDFGAGGKDYHRLDFIRILFETLDTKFKLILATTLSKSFALYGARVGASILLSKDSSAVRRWTDVAGGILRGMYSSASRPGQELALNILRDPHKLENIHLYQAKTVKLIESRRGLLLKLLSSLDFISNIRDTQASPLQYIEADGGFFTSLKIQDHKFASRLYKAMLAEHIYIPIISEHYLRLPVCAMSSSFTQSLIERISQIANAL